MAYYNPTLDKDALINRLHALDDELYLELMLNGLYKRYEMHIVGSLCLLMRNVGKHMTEDIDTYLLTEHINTILLNKYDFNMKSAGMFVPENYEDRLEKIDMDTKVIDYYMLSLEDVVFCKLLANRAKDEVDINDQKIADQLNWILLKEIMEENRIYWSYHQFYMFCQTYNDYCIRWNHADCIIENI